MTITLDEWYKMQDVILAATGVIEHGDSRVARLKEALDKLKGRK